MADVRRRLDGVRDPALAHAVARVREATDRVERHVTGGGADAHGRDSLEAGARALAFSIARTYAGALLLEHAGWCAAAPGGGGNEARRAAVVARRWCAGDLAPLVVADHAHRGETALIVRRDRGA